MGAKSKLAGRTGEKDIVKTVRCPNCGRRLMQLPEGYPLFDVQCTGCVFRAQVKVNNCKTKDQIFGSGWDIMEKNLRIGQLIPPLIVKFHWREGRQSKEVILFFPFLTKANLKQKKRSQYGLRPGYKEFNYVGLMDDKTPKVVL